MQVADEATIREFAYEAYNMLDGFPEFGMETRVAIIDTAAMLAYDAGYEVDREVLQEVARGLCG